MSVAEAQFMTIVQRVTNLNDDVHLGKMMSSPGLKVNDKVFSFFHDDSMCFRLGPHFEAQKFGVMNTRPLSPFKTKPPLKGWYFVDQDESQTWEMLADMALDFTRKL